MDARSAVPHGQLDAGIIVKMAVPECICKYDVRCAVGSVFIGCVEELAKIGLNTQSIEIVSARLLAPDHGWIMARVHPEASPRR